MRSTWTAPSSPAVRLFRRSVVQAAQGDAGVLADDPREMTHHGTTSKIAQRRRARSVRTSASAGNRSSMTVPVVSTPGKARFQVCDDLGMRSVEIHLLFGIRAHVVELADGIAFPLGPESSRIASKDQFPSVASEREHPFAGVMNDRVSRDRIFDQAGHDA